MFQFVVIHTVKGFSIVSEAEVDVFLEFPCFLHDQSNWTELNVVILDHKYTFKEFSVLNELQ